LSKAWQSDVVDAVQVCERGDGARIFVGPVEPGPGQQLRTAWSMRAAMRKPSSFISCSH
jgi:hypothetical protein